MTTRSLRNPDSSSVFSTAPDDRPADVLGSVGHPLNGSDQKSETLGEKDRIFRMLPLVAWLTRQLDITPAIRAAFGQRQNVVDAISLSDFDLAVCASVFLCGQDILHILCRIVPIAPPFPRSPALVDCVNAVSVFTTPDFVAWFFVPAPHHLSGLGCIRVLRVIPLVFDDPLPVGEVVLSRCGRSSFGVFLIPFNRPPLNCVSVDNIIGCGICFEFRCVFYPPHCEIRIAFGFARRFVQSVISHFELSSRVVRAGGRSCKSAVRSAFYHANLWFQAEIA